ncbi:hypothetical protein RHMOL_Rhmol13G0052900 [Rhododendron molle]|uniref:Uncharacterized protein n=1 Tax=Rhododendron molle TaxID=49168 RepID=A0ACC0L383_RHOML|nr:hypothetical protein RHMOL_Rhmol13G0052900 [Rhododendron molle]
MRAVFFIFIHWMVWFKTNRGSCCKVLGLKEEKFRTSVRRQGKAKNSHEKANGDGRKFPPRHYVARGEIFEILYISNCFLCV